MVINQSNYIFNDGSISRYLNRNNMKRFFFEKTKESLPKIEIELFIDMDNYPNASRFSGLHYSNHSDVLETGIRFVYEFDSQFDNDVNLDEFANNRVVPTEYYKITWNTFQGMPYKRTMAPIKMIYLDNSNAKQDLFGSYSRQIYEAKINDDTRRKLASSFKKVLSEFKNTNEAVLTLGNNQSIGIDAVKSNVVKLLDIYENDISIQDMGSGQESLIKIQMALHDKIFDLILIDEPENHLSFTRTRQLVEMIKGISDSQMVIATHSSLIVNRLNLKNTIWLTDSQSHSLKNLTKNTASYFEKIDNFDVLRYILAEKVILVEGAVEYIILPVLFKKITSKNMDEFGIDIISMGSISHERFREVFNASNVGKKTVVITDNDGKQPNFENEENFKIYAAADIKNWTLEVAFYNENSSYFNTLYETRKTEPVYMGKECAKALAHMLKNKTENALELENAINKPSFIIPDYLKEAIKWIEE